MAATNTNRGSGINTRWFQIGRKDFQDAGDSVFREFLKEPPAPDPTKQFTQHPKTKAWYQQFETIDGIITGITWEKKTISDQPQTMMIVTVEDGVEKFIIEVGNWDGKFSKNLMQRLCQPAFNPLIQSILKPYCMKPTSGEHAGKLFMGVTLYNGIDTEGKPMKLNARYEGEGFQMPPPDISTETIITGPTTTETKEKRDYRKQAVFLVKYLQQHIIPKLPTDVFIASNVVDDSGPEFVDDETAGGDGFPDDPNFPTDPPPTINTKITADHSATGGDDLPF